MIYRTSDEKIAAYEADGALNQSGIKVILKNGMQYFLDYRENISRDENYYSEKEAHIIGKAVDCIITGEPESFAKKYYGNSIDKPGDKVLSIVKWVYDNRPFKVFEGIDFYKDIIADACITHNYYSNWKIETRINSVINEGKAYWGELLEAGDKQVMSADEYNLSKLMADNILNHPHTGYLFKDDKGIDIVHQFPLFFNFLDIPCKALPDTLRIDHNLKLIYPIDVKTTIKHILLFCQVIKELRYDIQGAFYTEALKRCLVDLSNLIGVDVTKYEVRNFAFIAESKTKPGTPMKFPLSKEVLDVGEIGDGRYFKGYLQGVSIYKNWLEKDFSIEEIFKETNGTLLIEKDYTYNCLI